MIKLFVGDKLVSNRGVSMVETLGTFLGRAHKFVSQALCGHDYYSGYENQRMFLRCSKCHRETPGWDLTDIKPPTDWSKK